MQESLWMLLNPDLVSFLFHLFGFRMCYSRARIFSGSLIFFFFRIVLTLTCLPDSGCSADTKWSDMCQGKSHLLSSQSGFLYVKLRSRKSCSMFEYWRKALYISVLFFAVFYVFFCIFLCCFCVSCDSQDRWASILMQCCFS